MGSATTRPNLLSKPSIGSAGRERDDGRRTPESQLPSLNLQHGKQHLKSNVSTRVTRHLFSRRATQLRLTKHLRNIPDSVGSEQPVPSHSNHRSGIANPSPNSKFIHQTYI